MMHKPGARLAIPLARNAESDFRRKENPEGGLGVMV